MENEIYSSLGPYIPLIQAYLVLTGAKWFLREMNSIKYQTSGSALDKEHFRKTKRDWNIFLALPPLMDMMYMLYAINRDVRDDFYGKFGARKK